MEGCGAEENCTRRKKARRTSVIALTICLVRFGEGLFMPRIGKPWVSCGSCALRSPHLIHTTIFLEFIPRKVYLRLFGFLLTPQPKQIKGSMIRHHCGWIIAKMFHPIASPNPFQFYHTPFLAASVLQRDTLQSLQSPLYDRLLIVWLLEDEDLSSSCLHCLVLLPGSSGIMSRLKRLLLLQMDLIT